MSTTFNIASYMEERARTHPFQRAVAFPSGRDRAGRIAWTQLSFAELNRMSDAFARGLVKRGAKRGQRVSLLVKPSLEFIPLVFAVFKVGALPVLIDPGMGRKPFLACLERMAPEILIAEPIVQALRGLFPAAFRSVQLSVTVGRHTGWWGGTSLAELATYDNESFATISTQADDEAAILFTSGSTGPAKGVVYTHGIFDAQARFIRDMYGIEPGEVDLACFPLFGLFSMALGMTVVIPELDPTKPAKADPRKLVEAIQNQGCTSAFGSPAIWKNVARYATERALKLPSLKRILMAGAPVPPALHTQFRAILSDGAEVHTPYGATESLPVSSVGSNTILGETAHETRRGAGTCVGHPAPEMLIRIIRITDHPIERWEEVDELAPNEVGEICVRGPVVTPRYEGEPAATEQAKIRENVDGRDVIVHRMGDVGYLDDRGRLWFCGRKKHRVEVSNEDTLYPVPVEAIFDDHPEVFKTALVGVEGVAKLVVQPNKDSNMPRPEIVRELLALGAAHAHTRDISEVYFHPRFPVDVRHNAKIHREQLAEWTRRARPVRPAL